MLDRELLFRIEDKLDKNTNETVELKILLAKFCQKMDDHCRFQAELEHQLLDPKEGRVPLLEKSNEANATRINAVYSSVALIAGAVGTILPLIINEILKRWPK